MAVATGKNTILAGNNIRVYSATLLDAFPAERLRPTARSQATLVILEALLWCFSTVQTHSV